MAKKETNKTKPVKESKEKKNFFKNLRAELKKVIWPTPKQVFNNTVAVLCIVAVVGIVVFVLDVAFNSANKAAVQGIKSLKPANEVVENVANTDETAETTEGVDAEVVPAETTTEEGNAETTEEVQTEE